MKKSITIIGLMICLSSVAQSGFPVTYLNSPDTSKPLIFYITGDGGMNKFSKSLAEELNHRGFPVASLDAKSYFWVKKTPASAASAISTYIEALLLRRPTARIVLAGYSFGADVFPFIVNALPAPTRARISTVILVAPSANTDLEIHWSDMLGWNKKRSNDVASAINQMSVPRVLAIFADADKDDLPVSSIHLKNFSSKVLPGGHHFDGQSQVLAGVITGSLP
ncbi:MAG TPA: AcvB/VirJ family lysyl-phosphatidylglycerol hydrolase [Chitinophagaceae bacterium]|nr:AcvB/VirJ family lysyl-phosphatidylglycerol hydrolase [Chitinophagaceae bacterium]